MTVRVLIADDEEAVLELLEMVFSSQPGYQLVASCRDGAEAVERARELRPDLCVLDVRMPVMDGIEACRRILTDRPETVVIFVSGLAEEEYVERARAAGARDFVAKPFRIEQLHERVARHLPGRDRPPSHD